jgi:hypothetical protein
MRFLQALFEDRLGGIARLGNARPVDLRPGVHFMPSGSGRTATAAQNVGTYALGFKLLNGAGVRLLFRYADCCQSVENFFALDFQFTR